MLVLPGGVIAFDDGRSRLSTASRSLSACRRSNASARVLPWHPTPRRPGRVRHKALRSTPPRAHYPSNPQNYGPPPGQTYGPAPQGYASQRYGPATEPDLGRAAADEQALRRSVTRLGVRVAALLQYLLDGARERLRPEHAEGLGTYSIGWPAAGCDGSRRRPGCATAGAVPTPAATAPVQVAGAARTTGAYAGDRTHSARRQSHQVTSLGRQ